MRRYWLVSIGRPKLRLRRKVFRYYLNQNIRSALHWLMRAITPRQNAKRLDFYHEEIKKILIVRATFRMGDSLLAIPAIMSFRKRFPHARIDFLGAPISAELFRNLPIDNHFTITRRIPVPAWTTPSCFGGSDRSNTMLLWT
jgi:hypothetical protein